MRRLLQATVLLGFVVGLPASSIADRDEDAQVGLEVGVIVNTMLQDPGWQLIQAIDPAGTAEILRAIAARTPLEQCADSALTVCGEGKVCWVCVSSGPNGQSCAYSCQDGNGECTVPVPPGCFDSISNAAE